MRRSLHLLPAAGLLAAALSACGTGADSSDDTLDIVAGFYPLAFAADRIGGEHVEVANLTPAGVEPHDLELAPGDIAAIEEADYVVYLEGFIPALDDAVSQYAPDKALDAAEVVELIGYDDTEAVAADDEHVDEHAEEDEHGHEDEHTEEDDHADDHADAEDEPGHDHGDEALEGADPHIWLDPIRYAALGEALAEALAGIDGANADDYTAGAEAFAADLADLDQEFTDGLANRSGDDIVTSHAAFGYLADRYGLHQVAISGLSPDQEASSQRMAEIAAFVEEHGVTTIFFETLVSPEIAETIAAETGAETAALNPIEGLTADQEADGQDYFGIMRENLAALQAALGAA